MVGNTIGYSSPIWGDGQTVGPYITTTHDATTRHSKPITNVYGHRTGGYTEDYSYRRKEPSFSKMVIHPKKKRNGKRR